jgi:hypothetical protein
VTLHIAADNADDLIEIDPGGRILFGHGDIPSVLFGFGILAWSVFISNGIFINQIFVGF